MTDTLQVAVQAARAAGDLIRAGWGREHTVTLKGAINPVTEVDHAAEQTILRLLRAATPTYGIFSEEIGGPPGDGNARWIVDPLDGTVNYAHHLPYFCVSIALECRGRVELGVIYDPMLDQLFTVERGRGARLNGRPIRVSATATLGESVVASGFPYDVWDTGRNVKELAELTKRVQAVRINGAAALDLAYVACGRLDGYYDAGLYLWDLAAARLLVQEAGGIFSLHGGDPARTQTQTMIAANPQLYGQIKAIVLPGE